MTGQQRGAAWSTDAWRDGASASWLAQADRLESMLAPVLEPLFDRARLIPGERVLDVGCGRGATTRRAARLVGGAGAVTAVDVSGDLLDEARSLATSDAGALGAVEWLVADAQRAAFEPESFDAVISRFGVMFFDDPVDAFVNLRRATRPGGRLAIATWRPRDACAFQRVGWEAITHGLRANGYAVEDTDPTAGPYAFGVDDVVHSVLDAAGWRDAGIDDVTLPLYYGGPGSAHDAVDVALGMAGMQRFLERYDERAAGVARAALLDAFDAHHDGTGVRLDAGVMITTAVA